MLRKMLELARKCRYPMLYLKKQVRIGAGTSVSGDVRFEGKNKVGKHCILRNSALGRGTYTGDGCIIANAEIGKYCSIAYGFLVIVGKHPVKKFVSTHPSFFSNLKQAGFTYTDKQLFEEITYADPERKVCVKIGSDVWIGSNVMVNNGVTIGHGAVVGAGALVLKDVKPYEIVAGVPAKKIGERFTTEEQQMLLAFKWWEKDDEWIRENAHLFKDIELLKKEVQRSGS